MVDMCLVRVCVHSVRVATLYVLHCISTLAGEDGGVKVWSKTGMLRSTLAQLGTSIRMYSMYLCTYAYVRMYVQ